MDIIYITRSDKFGNDTEGAIAHALRSLGHTVTLLPESSNVSQINNRCCDFVLFHKWKRIDVIRHIRHPMAFWYFDLLHRDVEGLDVPNRRQWMREVIPYVTAGFCTDGEFVRADKSAKLVTLRQGADERHLGGHRGRTDVPRVLFAGNPYGPRAAFLTQLERVAPVTVIRGTYSRDLAGLVFSSRIVIAPPDPVADRYWSNRVYTTLGFEGFLIHPYADELAAEYRDGEDIIYYRSMDGCLSHVAYFLRDDQTEQRHEIARRSYVKTITSYLYRHRLAELVRVMGDRLWRDSL